LLPAAGRVWAQVWAGSRREGHQMARIIYRLTAVAVANVKAKGFYPDGGGLYLRVTSGFFDVARFSWSAFRAYFCATFNDLCRASAATASIAMPASDAAVYMPTRPL